MKEIADLIDELDEIVRLRIELNAPSILQKVGQDSAQPFSFARQRIETPQQSIALLGRQIRFVQRFGQKLGVESDRGKRVLDFVREAAGHRAKLGQSFGIASAALGAPSPFFSPA